MADRSLNLCFFWHMHQPDYRNSSGVMTMPWVFLHAIKDYYEMPWLLNQYKDLKATFNITASLIEQLKLYKDPLQNDYFLSLWIKHPSELNDEEREWLIKTCKSTQYETMIKPMENFDRLYHYEYLSDEDLIDFEVLFMLSWCGNYLRQGNSVVMNFFHKARGFTQADKALLLKSLCDFIATILPFYAKLQKEGIISLSTTPYNHPILPLLLDMNNAKRANAHTTLPENPISLREDAIEQVKRSIALYKETFDREPKGFWPAEGAVDEESVKIYKAYGLSWIATDEAILFRSLEDENRSNLYKPYIYKGMTIGFRDHVLSDLIGFHYRSKSGVEAAEHFMQMIEPIAQGEDDPTLFVILDGENAWEFFENNAYDFFTLLYEDLAKTPWCSTKTMDEVSKLKKTGELEKLSPGSWINGNFDTWSGHPQKNRAWELIYRTRRDVDNYQGDISAERYEKVISHFLAAECSDWFWWYGDDHITEFGLEFDSLFREHLIHIYRLINLDPPSDLFVPIHLNRISAPFLIKPQSSISPLINKQNTSFFEWIGCGSIDESKLYSTMDRVRGPIDMIYYGHNDKSVFIALEGDISFLEMSELKLQVTVEKTGETFIFAFSMDNIYTHEDIQIDIDKRIELALPKSHFNGHSAVHLRFEIVKGNEIVQIMPGYGALFIDLEETYADNWFV